MLFLSGCGNSAFGELQVNSENVPDFKETSRNESANKTLISVRLRTKGSGEKDAKKSVADSIAKLKAHYSAVIVEVIDKQGKSWYGVYIDNDNAIDAIKRENPSSLNKDENELLDFYRAFEEPKFPFLQFANKPILD